MATKNIVPRANKEGQLGTDAKQWNKVIAHTGSFQVVSSSLIPDSTNTYDLGSSTKFWKDIYVSSGSIKFIDPSDNSVASTLSVDSNGIFTLGNISLDSVVSSSTQISEFGFISSSVSIPDGTVSGSIQIASDISGSFTQPSASFSTRVTSNETNITNLQTDSGSFSTRITATESELGNTLISSSAQIATDISGSFTEASSSISTRLTDAETELSNTLISSSAQIASDISGSFTAGTGVTITSGEISIGQEVETTSNVNFGTLITSGDVTVGGNLDVQGTTTSIDSATLNIGDKNITIGSGSTTSAQLNEAGIDFGLGGDVANLRYRHSDTSITSSVDFRAPNFYGTFQGALSSSAQIADDISGSFTAASSSLSSRIATAEAELENTLISSSAQVDHDSTTNFVANEHIDHTSVTLTAGDGLTGGGDISSNRSFAVDTTVLRTTGDNILSGSAQIATDISGSFTAPSSSFSTRVTTNETDITNLQTDSGSFSTRVTTLETDLSTEQTNIDNLQTDSGSFSTRITTAESELSNTLFSSSAQVDHDSTTNFVSNEHINHSSVTITAGSGLTGGGDITTTRTINVGAGDGISVAADSVAVDATVLRTTGDSIVSASAQITHDSTTGFVANEHIDHSSVSITAGSGLTGGGTIAASRTIDIGAGTGIDVAADAISVDVSDFMTNGANNRVLTATGTDAMNAESGLTYDGSNLDVTGGVRATGDVVAFYSSDKRLKDNIVRIENPLDKIEKIGGYTYDWNDKQNTYEVGSKDFGVIAQEIQEVLPELVTERDNGYLAVKYEKIVPLLIESIKELKQEIDDIKQKCDCLNK